MSDLLNDAELERSEVVANSLMNRERGVIGANSYAKDLHFNPLEFLQGRLAEGREVAWLDLCCGSGKALIEAAHHFYEQGSLQRVTLVGVDLVAGFLSYPPEWRSLTLEASPLTRWEPAQEFDLITCVHGFHYIGDKLGVLRKTASYLKHDGHLVGNVELANISLRDHGGRTRTIRRRLEECGFRYDPRHRLLTLTGEVKEIKPFWAYIGADDRVGPNYTKQPVVNSYYDEL